MNPFDSVRSSDLSPTASKPSAIPETRARRAYSAPRLTRFGDIRDLTLGSSPGTGESGNPLVFRP